MIVILVMDSGWFRPLAKASNAVALETVSIYEGAAASVPSAPPAGLNGPPESPEISSIIFPESPTPGAVDASVKADLRGSEMTINHVIAKMVVYVALMMESIRYQ